MTARLPASTPREDLAGFLRDIESLETIFGTWAEEPRGAADAYRRAIEALHCEALRRLLRSIKGDSAGLAALKEAAKDEIVYAVLRHHGLLKPSVNERVEAALQGIRPALAEHGGDVRLLAVNPPAVEVEFVGACDGCSSSAMTFEAGIRKAVLDACPEITQVVLAKGRKHDASVQTVHIVSPFAR